MPRTYINPKDGEPLFSIEQTVGTGMKNDRQDVLLVQFFLMALLQSQKKLYASGPTFMPPDGGAALEASGMWDDNSRRHLARWEEFQRQYAADWHVRGPQFPGTVVPYSQGGMKIIQMNSAFRNMFGGQNHCSLMAPGSATLHPEVRAALFWDPLR